MPANAAQRAVVLSHWKAGSATAVAKCGGGVAAVHENDDTIVIADGAKRFVAALLKGARPRDIAAGTAGSCLVVEGGLGKIAVERAGRILNEFAIVSPSGAPYPLDRSSVAYDGQRIFVTVPQFQAIVRVRPDGSQQSIGTAFGDVPQNPRGWLFAQATAPKTTAQERLATDLVAVPPFPQVGPMAVAPDKAVWIVRYGGDPLYTELLRYSAQRNGFSVFPLVQMGFGALEPANLAFGEDGRVAFASQTPAGLRSISVSPFGEFTSSVVAPGAVPSRIGLSDRSSAYDARQRLWIVDADRRRVLLLASGVTCVAGPWKDPISIFRLGGNSFAVLDAASGTVYFIDPSKLLGAPCAPAV